MAKILIFYQYYSTPKGSWGTRYYEFTRRWVAAGHDVTVVTSIYDKSDLVPRGFVTRFEIEGAKILAMDLVLSNKHGVLRRLWTYLMYSLLSCWWGLVLPADVIVASSGPITVGVPGLLARWLRGKPLLFEVRDLWPEGAIETGMLRAPWAIALARWFERLCYEHATTVVALSPGMAAGVKQAAPDARVVTISNASDLDLFHPGQPLPDHVRQVADGRFVVLYASTLGRANGTTELVDIASELARRGARDVDLVVIGDGAERAEMERLARERGLDHLRFLGKLPKTEVAAWHEAAALTLCLFKPLPVTATCSPNKLFDSLAAGRPVVNNTNGWMAEMLARTGSGLSYSAGDAVAAADLILSLRDNASVRKTMGEAARATAERDYARDRLAAAFAELFPR